MDRLGKVKGMIELVQLVRPTISVSALAEVLFCTNSRCLLAIDAAVPFTGFRSASTNDKLAPVLLFHGGGGLLTRGLGHLPASGDRSAIVKSGWHPARS